MASQPTTGNKQRFRCRVQEIKLEPDKSTYDIAIELQVDGTRVHKLQPTKKGQLLHWTSLCLPCDVGEDSVITIRVTEVHAFQDRFDRAVYQISPSVAQDPTSMSQNLVSIGCENGMFGIQVTFLDNESARQAYLDAFNKVRRMEQQPGLPDKSGRLGHAFKALLALGGVMVDLDPTGSAKVVFSACTRAWEHLEQQKNQDAELIELVKSLQRMVPSVESVKNIAKDDLRETVMKMLGLVEDVSLFILDYRPRSSLERAIRTVANPAVLEQTQAFITKFRDLRSEFDTRVSVQTLHSVETNTQQRLHVMLQQLNPVKLVGYDPGRRCLAGTRTNIIGEIAAWAQRQDPGPRLAWIHGLAGLGKSSIAASVCEGLDGRHALASSVFCKRDNPELRDLRRVLMTIVHDLALHWEPYGAAVAAVLRDDSKIDSKFAPQLYDVLVHKPLLSLGEANRPTHTLTVVVDALDEFGDAASRKQLLG